MADFVFKISPNVVLGTYAANRLGQHALEYGEKFIVIMDPALKESDTAGKITDALKERGIDFFVFDEIKESASSDTIQSALNLAQKAKVHGAIAIGGGKTLSFAKALCAIFFDSEKTVYDYIDENLSPPKNALPLICLPSTPRDNFIFADRAFLKDSRSSKVKILKTQNGLCKLVVWDPNLQSSLNETQISYMTLQVLAFIVEGYISQKANFFSDMIIEKASQLFSQAVDGAEALSQTTPREILLTQAGFAASLGASSSSFGAANLLSLSINVRYKVSRSLLSAILLPHIIEDALTFKAEKLATLARILKACPADASTQDACQSLVSYVKQKSEKAAVPSDLRSVSPALSIEQLSIAVEDAGELELVNNLQRSMTSDDLFEIIKNAY